MQAVFLSIPGICPHLLVFHLAPIVQRSFSSFSSLKCAFLLLLLILESIQRFFLLRFITFFPFSLISSIPFTTFFVSVYCLRYRSIRRFHSPRECGDHLPLKTEYFLCHRISVTCVWQKFTNFLRKVSADIFSSYSL